MAIWNPQPFYLSGKAPPGVTEKAECLLPALKGQGQLHYFAEAGNLPLRGVGGGGITAKPRCTQWLCF